MKAPVPATLRSLLVLVVFWVAPLAGVACIWDSDTLLEERLTRPALANVILGAPPAPRKAAPQLRKIEQLKAKPFPDDPKWLNELAGAYLRSGMAQEAVDLLRSAAEKFPDDYGVHANLGTAYHLLGKYAEAEKHIARDLDINPEAHFGLERYHLALLQYLVRDKDYQQRHVYIDEWTGSFLRGSHAFIFRPRTVGKLERETNNISMPNDVKDLERDLLTKLNASTNNVEVQRVLFDLQCKFDPPPHYRYRWSLVNDPKFEEGIIYMASLNPGQPACFAMLGIWCQSRRNLNLAAKAYERAIKLGSPQADLMRANIQSINEHIAKARLYNRGPFLLIAVAITLVVFWYIISKLRARRNRNVANPS